MQTGAKPLQGGRSGRGLRRERGQRAESRRLYWYVAAVTGILVVLIGAGFYVGRAMLIDMPLSGGTAKAVSRTPPGYYMRRLEDGRSCRVTVFDHDRGEAIEDKITHCEELRPPSSQQTRPAPSIDTRPKKFNWGSQ